MCGVRKSVWRKDAGSHDGPRQRFGVFRDLQRQQATDEGESLLYFRRIADRGFVDDDLENGGKRGQSPIS